MAEYIPRPEDAKCRTLVLLLDGTGDSLSDKWTNVAELKALLYDGDVEKQKVLYLSGLGTSRYGKFKTMTQKFLEQTVGLNFDNYVIEPYLWLAENYREGDKICIFGFSRGAYTARVVAGMVRALGLLPKEKANWAEVKAAHALYKKGAQLPTGPGKKEERDIAWEALKNEYKDFKDKNQMLEIFIEFLGCWDTVNSIGVDRAIRLGYTRTNDILRNFRHAISLDEHRARFEQSMWRAPQPPKVDEPPKCITNVEEVWFAGCHSDVGGGSVLNGTRPNLAHIPLRWMIRECFKTKCGLIFNSEKIRVLGIEPSTIYPEVMPRPDTSSSFSDGPAKVSVVKPQGWVSYGLSFVPFWRKEKGTALKLPQKTEEDLDAIDAFAPAYDQLALSSVKWGYLERREELTDRQTSNGDWEQVKEAHQGMGRPMPPPENCHGGKIKVHRTVRMRMEGKFEEKDEKPTKYVPLAWVEPLDPSKEKSLFDEAVGKGWIEWVA